MTSSGERNVDATRQATDRVKSGFLLRDRREMFHGGRRPAGTSLSKRRRPSASQCGQQVLARKRDAAWRACRKVVTVHETPANVRCDTPRLEARIGWETNDGWGYFKGRVRTLMVDVDPDRGGTARVSGGRVLYVL
jgi:hypothetical protein